MAENCFSSSEIRDAICSSVEISPSINELKPEQILVVENIVRGKDVFAALLTGFGKGVTFQILPAVWKSLERSSVSPLVIVVCPLNSIIKDRVNYLTSLVLKAAFVGGSAEIDKRIIEGTAEIDLLYGSPESFVGDDKFRGMLSNDLFRKNAVAVVCDEVHTVVHWWVFSLIAPSSSNPLSLISVHTCIKVAEHSFQVPMPNSPLLLKYLCFGTRSCILARVCPVAMEMGLV